MAVSMPITSDGVQAGVEPSPRGRGGPALPEAESVVPKAREAQRS